jgi:K+-sensing histidine kinase KdpD
LLPRLFDRFYRADPARQEGSSEHAGLGLAITQSIVRAMAGRFIANRKRVDAVCDRVAEGGMRQTGLRWQARSHRVLSTTL